MHRWTTYPVLLLLTAFAFGDDAPAAPPLPAAPVAPVAPADHCKEIVASCRYVAAPFEMKARDPVKFGELLTVQALEYPSPVKSVDPERNDTVRAKLFTTATPEAGAVICLGGWRRDPISPMLGARVAEATGLQVLYIELPFQGERTPKGKQTGQLTFSADIDQNVATFAQAAQDVGRAVDWLIRERKVDPKRIGIMGTSLGGYVAADLYGIDDRFAAAVIQIAG
ncbi:MAG: prolyl oligopeptidase family serine peptidase, partial [Planctomycetes bacterium]|nr:prolyl oligopeptidase family serine peptidase [Planctomycetota bacterium]